MHRLLGFLQRWRDLQEAGSPEVSPTPTFWVLECDALALCCLALPGLPGSPMPTCAFLPAGLFPPPRSLPNVRPSIPPSGLP